jgi:hypothetical protein
MSNVRIGAAMGTPKSAGISRACLVVPHPNHPPFVASLRGARQAPAPSGAPPRGARAAPPRSTPIAVDREPRAKRERSHEDPLDPWARRAAQLAPMPVSPVLAGRIDPDASVQLRARVSLEDLLPALVRRVAWSGDGRRGTIRLELGAGSLAGATLVIHAEGGRVKVELSAPAGVDVASWRERIGARLHLRGLAVDGVEVE